MAEELILVYRDIPAEQATRYLGEYLWGAPMSQFLTPQLFAHGRFGTFLPPELADDVAYRMRTSWLFHFRSPTRTGPWQQIVDLQLPYVIPLVRASLQQHPRNYFLIEDWGTSQQDSYVIQHPELPLLWLGEPEWNSISYYMLTSSDTHDDQITSAVSWAFHPQMSGVLAPLPESVAPLAPQQTISLGLLATLVEQATLLIFGAYDGEGYLLWQRNQ